MEFDACHGNPALQEFALIENYQILEDIGKAIAKGGYKKIQVHMVDNAKHNARHKTSWPELNQLEI